MIEEIFPGVFLERETGEILTLNLDRGNKVYGERLVHYKNNEYRIWNPYRSKLCAMFKKGMPSPIKKGMNVLYLGAATGTTASHISDIIGPEGRIYCVEISPHALKKLIVLCERRKNMIPILGDANKPSSYSFLIEDVDLIYQDIAQPNLTDIFLINADAFLKKKGLGVLCIKTRSIDVTKDPDKVFKEEQAKIKERGYKKLYSSTLDPYDKDHVSILVEKRIK
ncbi:MAG: fibrillarin-like rRNA/tRNA 2'-O-methyltransferase [Candidatus Hydrothermarchaeota archaeon]